MSESSCCRASAFTYLFIDIVSQALIPTRFARNTKLSLCVLSAVFAIFFGVKKAESCIFISKKIYPLSFKSLF
ncbi:hypothetical protein L2747_13340 [Shewanella marinintestina]|uniref:hypothetical protein n=1 Tax=Shewanella marinintestina TaxID=190305 RepID=UPI00200F8D89|nr:hypothetical protein [Shewanella marinintestina]MCL1146984.1 hypothetical protein [Shewanella marinintestina]